LESTTDAVIVTDRANRLLLLNPAAAQVYEIGELAVRGLPIAQALKEKAIVRLLTGPLGTRAAVTDEVPVPDGRTFYASVSAIISGDNQAIGRVAVLRDVTYFKELDEIKSEFVATVSHDLRSPLTFMRGFASMIPMVGPVTSKQKGFLEKIMVGIAQMTELVDDLLDLRRSEDGVGLKRDPCRMGDIILSAVDSARARTKARGLTLRVNQSDDGAVVIGDATLLRRVVSNLLDNAVKYTPKGGTVTVGWEKQGDRVLISVADTGIGIAKADQMHLFEKFSRVKRRETINIKGSGLGLAIVKSVVERHGGKVWLVSELNRGSTFYVDLPAARQA
jgi:signal transduction histidine kinase